MSIKTCCFQILFKLLFDNLSLKTEKTEISPVNNVYNIVSFMLFNEL